MTEKKNVPTNGPGLGQYLFDEIRRQIPDDRILPKILSNVLNLTGSAVYKKLRGDSPLTLAEAANLATYFHISLDNYVLPQAGIIPMAYPVIEHPIHHPLDFLRDILVRMEKALRLPDVQLFYASSEIPLFHYLPYPELTAFKIFVWGRTTWELNRLGTEVLPEKLVLEPELHQICRQLSRHYQQLPSTEFWTLHILDNTLKQLQYFSDSGIFSSSSFPKMMQAQITQLLDEQEVIAASRHKINGVGGGTFDLYYNEIAHTNNTILLYSSLHSTAFTTFDNPNFLFSDNSAFTRHTNEWFLRLQKRSIALGGQAERERAQFFSLLHQRSN